MPQTTHHSLLVRLADADDQLAWEEFVAIYQPLIYRIARGRGLQDADAGEIVQEVLLSVSRSIGNYVPRDQVGGFRAWLATVTRNETLSRLRRRAVPTVGGSIWMKQIAEIAEHNSSDNADHHEFELETRKQIFYYASEKIRDRFCESNWKAFWLTCVDGLSAHEAAERLEIPVGKVYVARCRVIARLRETIEHLTQQPATDQGNPS